MDAAMPLSSASLRLLLASFLRMAGVSKRAASNCSSGVIWGMVGLRRAGMCIENPVFYAC